MNSLLQCLSATEGFFEAVERFPECRIQTFFSRIFQNLNTPQKHLKASDDDDDNNGTPKPITARPLLNYLQTTFGMDMYTQHDIHEILMLMLSSLHSMVGVPVNKQQLGSAQLVKNQQNPFRKLEVECMHRFYQDNEWKTSFITNNLCGQIIKQIVCGHCDDVNHNFETFTTFQLDILNQEHEETLDTSIREYFRPSMLIDWKCDKCKQCVPSEQRTYMWHLPKTLMVCLSRFQMTSSHKRMFKNNKLIGLPEILKIPSQHLLNPLYANDDEKPVYKLSSVACHHGSLSYGHYTSIVRDRGDKNVWYHIDDDVVSDCSKEIIEARDKHGYVFIPDAYLMVYNLIVDQAI
jgi:ubiquitin C-terminal hydrolase